MDAISTTVSGLNAAQVRLQVSANNIANANTPNYQAEQAVQTARASGGVDVRVVNRNPAPAPTTDTDGDNDNEAQDASAPDGGNNVSPEQELANTQLATYNYKANLRVLKTEDDLQQSLLDIRA